MIPPLRRKERKKREKILSWLISKKKARKLEGGHKERSRFYLVRSQGSFGYQKSILFLAHNSAVISFAMKIHLFSQVTFIFDFTRREIFNSTRQANKMRPKIALVVHDSAEYFQNEGCSSLRSSERNLQKQSKVPLLSSPGVLIYFSPFEALIWGGLIGRGPYLI